MSRAWTWTPLQLDKLNKAKQIIQALAEYKPLTLRQVYYQFVSREWIENNKSQYSMLSGLLMNARLDGCIAWDDITDRTRTFHDLTGFRDAREYIKNEMYYFLSMYERNLLQGQKNYIEVWIEKDALSAIFTRAARPYRVPVTICKGYASASFLNNYRERLRDQQGKNAIILYYGDFDPSGMNIPVTIENTLKQRMQIENLQVKRIALLKEDIERYQLPHSPEAIKAGDTRTKKHLEEYGELAVELDALRPDILLQKIHASIKQEIDMDGFNEEKRAEVAELDMLNTLKEKVAEVVNYE